MNMLLCIARPSGIIVPTSNVFVTSGNIEVLYIHDIQDALDDAKLANIIGTECYKIS